MRVQRENVLPTNTHINIGIIILSGTHTLMGIDMLTIRVVFRDPSGRDDLVTMFADVDGLELPASTLCWLMI